MPRERHESGIDCKSHQVYELSCEEYEALWARSGGSCEACGRPIRLDRRDHAIDHDHRYGNRAVRGIVCYACNSYLSRLENPRINPVFPGGPGRWFASYFLRSWFTRGIRRDADESPIYIDHDAVRADIREWSVKNKHLHATAPKAVVVPTDQVRELVRILRAAMSPQAFARLAKLISEEAAAPKKAPPPNRDRRQ